MKTFSRHIEYSKPRCSSRARGFTILELLIVIAIAAILSALILGGFFQITASNRRSGCQVNMSQIYNALRLYANDYDGAYPYYNDTAANGGVAGLPVDTMGLWKLYTVPVDPANAAINPFPSTLMSDGTTKKPVGIYLRSAKNLHCPNDVNNENQFDTTGLQFNPGFLSYQTIDDGKDFYPASTAKMPTYQTQRTTLITDPEDATDTATPTRKWNRQLLHWDGANRVLEKRPTSDTVILWCKWHRTGLGGRNNDIVLFADGSVKSRPLVEAAPGQPQPGWQRTP